MSSSSRRSSRRDRMISLCSSDGETIMVEENVAKVSIMLKSIIENNYDGHVINLPSINGRILSKVIEYCKAHAASDVSTEDLKAFDDEFIQVEPNVLFGLFMACAFTTLNIRTLRRLTQQGVYNLLKGKSVDEIRQIYASVRRKNTSTNEEARCGSRNKASTKQHAEVTSSSLETSFIRRGRSFITAESLQRQSDSKKRARE